VGEKTKELLTSDKKRSDAGKQATAALDEPEKEQAEDKLHYLAPAKIGKAISPDAPPFNNGQKSLRAINFFQKSYGNLATLRHFNYPIQAKLAISQPNDPHEQEADRVAEQVMSMSESRIQKKPGLPGISDSSCRDEQLVQKRVSDRITPLTLENDSSRTPAVTSEIQSHVESINGGGQELPESVRSYFEPRFGYDFRNVRLHTGPGASEAARSVNAKAFTHGKDIVFGEREYAPATNAGQRLLAHELTHVVQQRGGVHTPFLSPLLLSDRKASAVAESATNDARPPRVELGNDMGVARQAFTGAVMPAVDAQSPTIEEMTSTTARPFSNEEQEKRKSELKKNMSSLVKRGIDDAQNGHDVQQDHMENVRGVAGTLSDWWNDVLPPFIGMWNNAIGLLRRAEALLAAGDLRGAHIYLVNGYELLTDARRQWSQYMTATIEGAQTTITTLTVIRDGAIAIEVGLLTGGSGIVGGGVVGSTLVGVGTATYVASTMESPLGEATRGTLAEIRNTGVMGNLRLAANGLVGILYGTGEGLTGIAKSLANMFLHPIQFVDDLLKLPSVLDALWEHRQELWDHFASLPSEQQAFEVGRLTGQIEAMLIAAETTKAGGAALSEALSEPIIFTIKVPQWVMEPAEVAAPALIWVDRAVTINAATALPALPAATALGMGGNITMMSQAAKEKAAPKGGGGGGKAPKKQAPAKKAMEEPTGEPEYKTVSPAEAPVPNAGAAALSKYSKLSIRQLRKLALTDAEAAEALRLRYRDMTDRELADLARRGDVTAKAVRSQRVPSNENELQKILGSDYRPPHEASAVNRDPHGKIIWSKKLASGNMTPVEEALGYPKSALATHTEARAVAQAPLVKGGTLSISGQYDPCGSCQRAMAAAATKSGATIIYWWPGGRMVFLP